MIADTSINIILRIFFLIFSNENIHFIKKKLIRRFYITIKTLLTIKKVQLINKKEITKIALDKNIEIFIIYINSISLDFKMTIYIDKKN